MADKRTVRLGMWVEFTPKTKIEEQNMLRCLHAMYTAMQQVPGVGNAGYENPSAESFEAYWDPNNSINTQNRTRLKDPRQIGGVYYCGYWRYTYQVLDIQGSRIFCRLVCNDRVASNLRNEPQFTVGREWSHMTAWNPQLDKVVSQPTPMRKA